MKLLGKKLLFVTAHPDDESFFAAGTMHKNLLAGGQCALVCATFGERGKGHIKKPVTVRQLKIIRSQELKAMAELLKLKNLFCLNLPDGRLCDCQEKLEQKVFRSIESFKPHIVISFGPDGITGHKDHVCLGKICRRLAKKAGLEFASFAAGPIFQKEFEKIKQRRKFGVYIRNPKHLPHTLRVAADPKIKMKAIVCHVSQSLFKHFSKKALYEVLHYDFFRV